MPVKKTEIPMQIRSLPVTPASINEDARTVDVVWTSGAAVRRFDWWDGETYMEVLEVSETAINMERLMNGAPVLDSHDSWGTKAVVGVVESARIENGQGVATLRFAENDAEAETIWNKVKQRILRSISVGYSVEEFVESVKDGIRTLTATRWTPLELSVVAVPADAAAQVRSNEKKSPCVIISRTAKPVIKKRKIKKRKTKEPIMKRKRFKRELENLEPEQLADVAEVVAEEADKVTEAVENAQTQLENLEVEVPAEVTEILDELSEAVDTAASDAETAIEAVADAASSEEDNDEGGQRALSIMRICENAGASIAEARKFVASRKSAAQVRKELINGKADKFKDSTTRAASGASAGNPSGIAAYVKRKYAK